MPGGKPGFCREIRYGDAQFLRPRRQRRKGCAPARSDLDLGRLAAKRLHGRLSGTQKLRVLAIETRLESNINDLARCLRSRCFDAPPKDGKHALVGFV